MFQHRYISTLYHKESTTNYLIVNYNNRIYAKLLHTDLVPCTWNFLLFNNLTDHLKAIFSAKNKFHTLLSTLYYNYIIRGTTYLQSFNYWQFNKNKNKRLYFLLAEGPGVARGEKKNFKLFFFKFRIFFSL